MMALKQSRSCNIMVNIEPAIFALVRDLIDKDGASASGYARKLIIDDLRRRGVLTDNMLADLVIGSIR